MPTSIEVYSLPVTQLNFNCGMLQLDVHLWLNGNIVIPRELIEG